MKELWLTNLTNAAVVIEDLNYLKLDKKQQVNLLHPGYRFTIEQIQQSIKEGSINKKITKLLISNKKRKAPPSVFVSKIPFACKQNCFSLFTKSLHNSDNDSHIYSSSEKSNA